MKRKPIDILASIINSLNGYKKEKIIHINSLREKSNIHWTTSKEYLYLIYFIQRFAPQIEIDSDSNNYKITNHSRYFGSFKIEEQIIIHLFLEKAFNAKSGLSLNDILNSKEPYGNLSESKYIRLIKDSNEKVTIYLSTKGKYKAQGILSRINEKMSYFIENREIITVKNEANRKIKPLRIKQDLISKQEMEIPYCQDDISTNYENSGDFKQSLTISESATIKA